MTFYVCDTEAPGLLDEADKFWCLVFKVYGKSIFHVFCDMEELANFDQDVIRRGDDVRFYPMMDYIKLLDSPKTKGLICHNILGMTSPSWRSYMV